MRLARTLRDLVNELGARGAVLYALDRTIQRFRLPLRVRSYLLVDQPIPERRTLNRRRAVSYVTRSVLRNDPTLAAMPLEPQTIAFRFDQGAQCYGLFRGDDLIAYLWLHFHAYDEDEVRVRFEPRPAATTCWDFDVYVHPKHRLGTAFLKLWDDVNAELYAAGIRHTISRISAFNLNSQRSHRRLGATVVGRVDVLRLGRVQLLMSTLRPRIHVSWRERQRPVVAVPAGTTPVEGGQKQDPLRNPAAPV
mgnify:CR=1 FL=1